MKNQTKAIYKVEDMIIKSFNQYSLDECQQYVDELRRTYGFRNKITVVDGRGYIIAQARLWENKRIIRLPRWARNPYVIIHEFCHHLSQKQTGIFDHEELFASNLLKLVKSELDSNTYKRIKLGYKKHKIKWS